MKLYFDLFFAWAKIGLFTFGGGYAMLPLIEKEIIDNRHWATYEEVMDYYAIGQCTPGIIAVNTATFVGYKTKGIAGGIFATLGVIFPSLVIITFIATVLTNFADIPVVVYALDGIKIGVCVLMSSSIVKLFGKSVVDKLAFVIFAVIFLMTELLKINVVFLVIIAALLGVFFSTFKASGKDK